MVNSRELFSDPRLTFLKFRQQLVSLVTSIEFTIGNENHSAGWALIYDTAEHINDASYPTPTSAPRRRLHRQTQIFLHRLLLDAFQDHYPALIGNFIYFFKLYKDEALRDANNHP